MPKSPQPAALAPYRVLDLTEGGSNLGAKMLADMGADVIRIEPPGGSQTRRRPPFYHDEPHRERSLFWHALNLNKRGITLNIESPAGRELLRRLAVGADFVFESFDPGYLSRLGLGYDLLSEGNPGLIMVSITPFGQTGPYAGYRGPDIVPWAMGGYMWMCGDPDRPPVRPSIPEQAYFHASASASGAALIALRGRSRTGRGAHIDQSAQACGPWMLTHTYQFYEFEGRVLKREGAWRQYGSSKSATVYPCKDGHVVAMLTGGALGGPQLNRFVTWMAEEGMAQEWMREVDWATYDARLVEQSFTNDFAAAATAFFRTKTKRELMRAAITRGLHLAPVNTVKDVMENEHLTARGYWTDVESPGIGDTLRYPGAPYIASETPWRIMRPAPRVGEHNDEVYRELGVSQAEMERLKKSGVV